METSHMKEQIRIVLVDDHKAIRESWKFFLEKDARFIVIAQCANGNEAIEKVGQLLPDIILMDINMQPVNGFEATKIINQRWPQLKIIGLSVNNHPGYAQKMMELGASGFVTKSSTLSELTTAILKAHAGEHYICEEIRNGTTYHQKMH
jgi:two-component system, NarL family, invasion response regulator UvrY